MFRSQQLFRVSNYNKFLSATAAKRKPSPIRALQPFLSIPGMISLGGGTPSPNLFPVTEITVKTCYGETLNVKADQALQYSPTPGHPGLVKQLMDVVKHCNPNLKPEIAEQLKLCITTGSQDALAKGFETFLSPGDTIITENPTYSGSLAFLVPYGANVSGIPVDDEGMRVDVLEEKLTNWNTSTDGPFPRVVYTIPTGSNPTGATLSESRRQKLYDLCCRHDLLIMEDDPYFHLYFHQQSKPLRTLLDRDVEGRVVRFESLSKVFSAGARIGFAVGPAPLIERIELHTQATSLHASGISQGVCESILNQWGVEGFLKHCAVAASYYHKQSEMLGRIMGSELKGLAEWSAPDAGMFFWIDLSPSGIQDTASLVKRLADEKVLLLPGGVFSTDDGSSAASQGNKKRVRASFSMANEQQMKEAVQRLKKVLIEESQRK